MKYIVDGRCFVLSRGYVRFTEEIEAESRDEAYEKISKINKDIIIYSIKESLGFWNFDDEDIII